MWILDFRRFILMPRAILYRRWDASRTSNISLVERPRQDVLVPNGAVKYDLVFALPLFLRCRIMGQKRAQKIIKLDRSRQGRVLWTPFSAHLSFPGRLMCPPQDVFVPTGTVILSILITCWTSVRGCGDTPRKAPKPSQHCANPGSLPANS
jgi:hypothetical protein